jgi:hypothetical protein
MTHRDPPTWRGRIPVAGQRRHVAPQATLPARVGKEPQDLRGLVPQHWWGRGSAWGEGEAEDPRSERRWPNAS